MSNFLQEHHLQTKTTQQRIRASRINVKLVSEKYKNGASIKDLELEFNVSDSVIKRCLAETNTKIRTNSEAHTKYSYDLQYFDHIDTYNKAYLLGFLCADGFITDRNEIGIEVKTSDIEVVEFFAKELKTNKPIYYNKDNKSAGLRIQNQHLTEQIKKYNIVPRKSLTLNIADVIQSAKLTDLQIKAFLLGYFDGDGCIYHYQPLNKTEQFSFNITGTKETCLYFQTYFQNTGFLTKRHPEVDNNNYTYQVGGRNQVKKCLSQLYEIKDKLTFYYDRKYRIFTNL